MKDSDEFMYCKVKCGDNTYTFGNVTLHIVEDEENIPTKFSEKDSNLGKLYLV